MDKDRMDDWSRGLIVAVAVAVKDGWMDRKQRSRKGEEKEVKKKG